MIELHIIKYRISSIRLGKETIPRVAGETFIREVEWVGVVFKLIVAVSVSVGVAHQRDRPYFEIVAPCITDVDDACPFRKFAAGFDDIARTHPCLYTFNLGENLTASVILRLFGSKNHKPVPITATANSHCNQRQNEKMSYTIHALIGNIRPLCGNEINTGINNYQCQK